MKIICTKKEFDHMIENNCVSDIIPTLIYDRCFPGKHTDQERYEKCKACFNKYIKMEVISERRAKELHRKTISNNRTHNR